MKQEDIKRDKAILAATTERPWIAVSPRSQEGGPQLAAFGGLDAPDVAVSVRVAWPALNLCGDPDATTATTFTIETGWAGSADDTADDTATTHKIIATIAAADIPDTAAMRLGDAMQAQRLMPWEQHEANATAAVHAVNRLPEYIAEAEEMQRRVQQVEDVAARANAIRVVEHDHGRGAVNARAWQSVLRILRGEA